MSPVALLTDFGGQDHYVGVVKGVLLGIHPQVRVIDLGHGIPAYGWAAAQFVLGQALPYFPVGTIFVVIVDPGVGGTRRPLALQTGTGIFVGPDNGIFTPLFPQVSAVVELNQPNYWRTPSPSQTFHGRDIFAPVAAHLSLGVSLAQVGAPVHLTTLVHRTLPSALRTPRGWQGHVQYIDHFGNLISTIPASAVPECGLGVKWGEDSIPWGTCYGDVPVGELVALVGSHGYVEIACHQGHAARVLDAKIGDEVGEILGGNATHSE